MGRRFINEIQVVDVEKRRVPSKHYVYIITVRWTDGTENIVYRRYSKFFELQIRLLEEFPTESGCNDPTKRIIPFLPGKKLFGRSHVRSVALQRMEPINEYCKTMIKLPPKISQHELVIKFFEPTSEDILPPTEENDKRNKKNENRAEVISEPMLLDQYVAIADYRKQAKNELSLVAGDVVEVFDKNENGWWFVHLDDEQGWVPASFLEPADGTQDEPVVEKFDPGEEEKYVATESYKPEQPDEVGLEKGVVVEVTQKCADGWWLVRYGGKEGWAPGMYLRKLPAGHHISPRSARKTSDAKPSPPLQRDRNQENQGGSRSNKPPPRKASVKRSVKLRDRKKKSLEKQDNRLSNTPEMFIPETEYVALADFRASAINSGLDVKEGVAVEVLEKSPNGWWYGKLGDREGWMPSSFLEKREKAGVVKPNPVAFGYKVPVKPSPPIPAKPTIAAKPAPGVLRKPRSKSLDDLIAANNKPAEKPAVPRPRSPVAPYEVIEMEGSLPVVADEKPKPLPRFVPKYNEMLEKQKTKEPPKRPSNPPSIPSKPQISRNQKPLKPEQEKQDKEIATVLSNYEPDFEGGVAIREKQEVEVLEKTEHWWFVRVSDQTGWAPANYLQVKNTKVVVQPLKTLNDPASNKGLWKEQSKDVGKPGLYMKLVNADNQANSKKELYVAIASYEDDDGEALNITQGETMELLEKSDGGWWFVDKGGDKGWVPSNYIQPL